MRKIGPYILIKTAEFPLFERANKLARVLSDSQIEDLLKLKVHLRRNPKRKQTAVVEKHD